MRRIAGSTYLLSEIFVLKVLFFFIISKDSVIWKINAGLRGAVAAGREKNRYNFVFSINLKYKLVLYKIISQFSNKLKLKS